ncbi:protein-disulfide reductase DsbD domain-containing protein [Rhizosphaericola mali]|uniref:Sugar transporter n=1 Tax=Rhizosphaericola mali TaxID=2545455 RepID=A0A5P2G0J0_9BACT|nr:protein-disulfide reductase DsbD domain-containing protein [Rhizosphaericola mali]QES87330.1 sugar transporter [Rhizosphaericola mali]
MKRSILALMLVFSVVVAFAQGNPVKWSYKAVKKGPGVYAVIITSESPAPWHIYSQTTPDGGPVPTKITFAKNPLVTLNGGVKEAGDLKTTHDKNFGVDVKYFSGKTEFTQLVKVKGKVSTNLKGTVEFMVCNDHECLPPSKQEFTVKL